MALDAAMLSLCAKELATQIIDAKTDKIAQPTRDEILFTLRSRRDNIRLFLSARSGSARVCTTTESFENPQTPPSFCMLLRKHFGGGRIINIRAQECERILFFDFACTNDMGDSVINTLSAELMGRYSNIVLINQDGKIIDALKRVDFEDSDIRQLLPGLKYTLPPKPDKLDFVKAAPSEIVNAILQFDLPVSDALMKVTAGIGPVICREASFRTFGSKSPNACILSETEKEELIKIITQIQADYNSAEHPCIATHDGKMCEYSFTALTQYGSENLILCDGFSQMLELYYQVKDKQERLRQKSHELHKAVRNMHERSKRKLITRRDELLASEKSDILRVNGELLNANLWAFNKGDKSVKLLNWYNGEEQTIPLDPRLSPTANAQKYFKDYKKRQTAAKMLVKLISEGEAEIKYLESVVYEVENAEGEAALGEIRNELKSAGYLKYYKVKDKKQKPADFYRYRSSGGFLILVGRNNAQNEKLTLKTARGKDYWFHVKNAPGSHTVIMSEGQSIPDADKTEAAMLAVVHSSLAGGEKIPVDFTEVKNIRKTNDLPLGMVIYDVYETAFITPDNDIKERLCIK